MGIYFFQIFTNAQAANSRYTEAYAPFCRARHYGTATAGDNVLRVPTVVVN